MVLRVGRFQNLAVWTYLIACAPAFAADVLTQHNDQGRTGQNLNEVILTPSNVNSTQFGLLHNLSVDGKVDAQPLYVSGQIMSDGQPHNVLIVATEKDSVYAFDADSGATLWQVSVLGSGESPSDDRGCGQVSPTIGVTGTPVIDLNSGPNGTVYLVAMSKNSSAYFQRLHALNLKTGSEQFAGPVTIQGTYPGTGDDSSGGNVVFDPKQYKARPGLLLSNGAVYIGWSSHCDDQPYTAWLMGYNESTLARISLVNFTPNGQEGSIWQAGAGPAADAQGNIYFLMANGTFDTTLTSAGFPASGDYGNGFMKVAPFEVGGLTVTDYFTMSNTVSESNGDEDLGSGGAMLLPDMVDANGVTRHLAVGAGKDANIYIVDTDNMGKFSPTQDLNYQLPATLGGGVWSSPAYFNGMLYYGASGDVIRAYQFSQARLASSPFSESTHAYPYPGATPSISANGTSNGIVWVAENTSPAVLHAYGATTLGTELYNTNTAASSRDHFGAGNKYIVPTIANGKVYVGTTASVGVFGLLPGNTKPAIVSSLTASGTTGTPFRYQIAATNGATSFGATPLPAGLVFNAASGVIAGTPSVAGTTSVTISASNTGGTVSATLSISISNPCPITLTPATRSFPSGGGNTTVAVTVASGCSWTATTTSPTWIGITGSLGSGSGSFGLTVSSNSGQARLGTVTVGDQSFVVLQSSAVASFNDVPAGTQYLDSISLMSTYGITAGCSTSPPLYCPDDGVTREQMAVFVVVALDRALNQTDEYTPAAIFQDVSSSSVYYPFVQRLYDLGITAGCSTNPPDFCATNPITQGEMAVYIIVAWMQANNLTSFTYTTTPYFTDVPSTDLYFRFVQKMRDMGFWDGCSSTEYCETSNVTRGQMAPMLMRSIFGTP